MSEAIAVVETELAGMKPQEFFISECIKSESAFKLAARRLSIIIETGLLPDNIKTPQQAMVAIEYGADMGMGLLESLRSVQVVKGHPCLKAGAIGSLIKKRFGADAFVVDRCDNTGCVIRVKQLDQGGEVQWAVVEFLEADAKAAGLFGSGMYKKYPADMYYARAISRVMKRHFQHLGTGEIWVAELVDRKPLPTGLGDV